VKSGGSIDAQIDSCRRHPRLRDRLLQASDDLLSELEEVYLLVLSDSISEENESKGVRVVALHNSEGRYIAMPDKLWAKLADRLEAMGVDVSAFAKSTDIDWSGDQLDSLFHKPTGKHVWTYSICEIVWEGGDRLYVKQLAYRGVLMAQGTTYVLEKQNGKWEIVDKIDQWVS
jgi:hypothetical protein